MIFTFTAAFETSHFGVRWFWYNRSQEETLSQLSDLSALSFPTPGEYNTHNGPSTPAKEGDTDRPPRASDGKLRGRSKRSSDPSPAGDNEIEVTPDASTLLSECHIHVWLEQEVGTRVLSKSLGGRWPFVFTECSNRKVPLMRRREEFDWPHGSTVDCKARKSDPRCGNNR